MPKKGGHEAHACNSFSALAAYEDADALGEEVAASLERRMNGSTAPVAPSDTGKAVGFKQPLVRRS